MTPSSTNNVRIGLNDSLKHHEVRIGHSTYENSKCPQTAGTPIQEYKLKEEKQGWTVGEAVAPETMQKRICFEPFTHAYKNEPLLRTT